MTIASRFAAFASTLQLADAPLEVVDAATRLLADTLGCAIAAAREPNAAAVEIVVAYAAADRARPEASVIGTDWQTSLRAAALANCTLARYIDANDIYMPVGATLSGSGHFSDAVPALLAAAESVNASGAALLEALIVSYEVQAALAETLPWLDVGFHSVSQVTVAVALAGGRLLGLDAEQLAHAAALAITTGLFLQSWLHPASDVPVIKGGAPGLAAERGVTCAQLAASGFTAPLDAFETFFGNCGEYRAAAARAMERLGREWLTPRNAIKPVPAQIFTQAVAQCASQMYREGLRMETLKHLTVYSNAGACARVQGSPGAFRPASREAADHSTPFVTALTLRDGEIGPATYHDEPWRASAVLDAMSKMSLVVDEGWSARLRKSGLLGAEVEAEDVHGRRFQARVEQFRGHPDNPLSRAGLIAKLDGCFGGVEHSGGSGGRRLLQTCETLAGSTSVRPLIECWQTPAERAGSHLR